MKLPPTSTVSRRLLPLIFLGMYLCIARANAQTESILYDFSGGGNGETPAGGLLGDGRGNYFGVTLETQTTFGTVFELTPHGSAWTLTTIYSFRGGNDGANPNSTLVMDGGGNLYGETSFGGNGKSLYCNGGCGTVFQLSPDGNGGWTKTTLYSFQGNQTSSFDGSYPVGGLTLDKAGNLYGTTLNGGGNCSLSNVGCGVVFELSPDNNGGWSEKLLHQFLGAKGAYPEGGVIFDSLGNLYGTTFEGGPANQACFYGCGTVFKLAPQSGGSWMASILLTFNGSNGAYPSAGLVLNSAGNLYGTTSGGGTGGVGVVLGLEASASTWKAIPIYQFRLTAGNFPSAPLTIDHSGNIYGTTEAGPVGHTSCPAQGGCGVVFKLTQLNGKWQESTVHAFAGPPDGTAPFGSVTIDSQGNLFGTTGVGGTANLGAIYEITP